MGNSAFSTEKILSVEHYTDRLFSFRATRPKSFRFRSGEFVMLGLEQPEGKPILRAYSVTSPSWDDELEFFSIKVPGGPLTSKLQKIKPGDELVLGKKPTGTLVLDALTPGKRLYMFSTGTGFAPFASLIRDPETYEKFEEVIVTHTCRELDELQYSEQMVKKLSEDPLIGEMIENRLKYFPSTTRCDSKYVGRITHFIETGLLYEHVDTPLLNPETDRVMICGSNEMIADTKALIEKAGLTEGSNSRPAEYVIEKAFAG
ncbi:MAG: ferredoxin--NADP reductase [Pseudomonadota bacterium]